MQASGRETAYCAIKLFKYNLQLIAFHSGKKIHYNQLHASFPKL